MKNCNMKPINYVMKKNLVNIFVVDFQGYLVDLPMQAKMTQFITVPLLIIITIDNLEHR